MLLLFCWTCEICHMSVRVSSNRFVFYVLISTFLANKIRHGALLSAIFWMLVAKIWQFLCTRAYKCLHNGQINGCYNGGKPAGRLPSPSVFAPPVTQTPATVVGRIDQHLNFIFCHKRQHCQTFSTNKSCKTRKVQL